MEEYPHKEEFLVLLDTISFEFKAIINHKIEEFGKIIRIHLENCRQELNNVNPGSQDQNRIISRYVTLIKSDKSLLGLYGYFEYKSMDFTKIVLDFELRGEFFSHLISLSSQFLIYFNSLTKNLTKKYYKDQTYLWIQSSREKFTEFMGLTPRIGFYDRLHLLALMLFSLKEKRNIKFLTLDNKVLSLKEQIQRFIIENNIQLTK